MKKINKILLSIPSILFFSYMLTFWFPSEFAWLVPSMNAYYVQIFSLHLIVIVQAVILIIKIWSFKNVQKSKKTGWTWLLIAFTAVTALIFIWGQFDQFEKLNNNKG